MKYITIKLTQDQKNAVIRLIEDYQLKNGLRSYHEKTPEQEKQYAFLQRIITVLEVE